jgi:hypothetical protein
LQSRPLDADWYNGQQRQPAHNAAPLHCARIAGRLAATPHQAKGAAAHQGGAHAVPHIPASLFRFSPEAMPCNIVVNNNDF